jgi:hypothetical protein
MRHLIIATLLAVSSVAAEPTINVHTQLIELPAGAKLPKDITQADKIPKADSVAVPDARTPSGEPTKVSVARDFVVAGKGNFQTGVFLTIRPTLDGELFGYSVDFESTVFVSFAARSATKAPVLSTQRIVGIDGQCASGEPVWLDLGVREDKQVVSEPGKRDRTQIVRTRLIAILTFNKA